MQDGGPLWTKRVGVSRPSAAGLGRVFHSGRLDLPSEPAHPPVLASPASTVLLQHFGSLKTSKCSPFHASQQVEMLILSMVSGPRGDVANFW